MRFVLLLVSILTCVSSARAFNSPKANPHQKRESRLLKAVLSDAPNVEIAVHNIGEVWMTITNIGQFGTGFLGSSVDPYTGLEAPACVFPSNSMLNYLYVGAFWIGAVVGRDTLVSIGVDDYYSVNELWPAPGDVPPPVGGSIVRRSIQKGSPFYDEEARSEQDMIAVYTDTLTDLSYVLMDPNDGRPHVPLNIEVTQRSYAWSYSYAQDFILFDYSIKNIGHKELKAVYMGIFVDGDVHHESMFGWEGWGDDLCGFRRTFPSPTGCGFIDTINIAYITDNDGDPDLTGEFTVNSARGAAGIRVVRTPSDSLEYTFNWWATDYSSPSHDFGPRRAGTDGDPFRDMNGVLGTALGDANKYYVMRHREFDYDQLFTGKDNTASGWLPRPANAEDFADGYDARYMLSFGPFDISPGEVLPVSLAWVLGDNIHVNPDDFSRYYDFVRPEVYYATWDFSDLAKNSMWASWIFDNPGVDTDGDGSNWGKYRICAYDSQFVCVYDTVDTDPLVIDTSCDYEYTFADTFWYEGDGLPDFRGASPPPPPELWVIDTAGDTLRSKILPRVNGFNQGELRILWNGVRSETARDVFSNKMDFEGYRVYSALSPVATDFTLICSYDIEDFNRYTWNPERELWELRDTPFSIDSLKKLYGDDFDPAVYDRDYPFYWEDSAYYFANQDWNQSDFTDTTLIHKVYPDQPPPSTPDIDSARIHYPEELTDDGLFFKYYEYEYIYRDLLPSQMYYVAVTAFDYGSPLSGLGSLEIPPQNNFVAEYPQNPASIVEEHGLNVIVYPNPYRNDGQYKEYGFEGRDYIDNAGRYVVQRGLTDERTRSIHFTNLPSKCTIRIFTIDGDLVREIDHDVPADFPQSSHERWDLITRNTQQIVSGIYYYSVESDAGNQVGTIVIIM